MFSFIVFVLFAMISNYKKCNCIRLYSYSLILFAYIKIFEYVGVSPRTLLGADEKRCIWPSDTFNSNQMMNYFNTRKNVSHDNFAIMCRQYKFRQTQHKFLIYFLIFYRKCMAMYQIQICILAIIFSCFIISKVLSQWLQ